MRAKKLSTFSKKLSALDESQDILRLFSQDCGAMSDKKVPATEAPKYRNARQAGIRGSLKVHIRISDIDRLLFRNAELTQSRFHHIRLRLSGNALLLADCDIYYALEEGPGQLVNPSLQLVADHSHTIPSGMQSHKQGGNAWIEARMVLAMNDIVRPEGLEALLQNGRLSAFRNRPFDELTNAVTNELAYFVEASFRQTAATKSMVHTQEEVLERVRQRSIQIEYDCLILHLCHFRAAKVRKFYETLVLLGQRF